MSNLFYAKEIESIIDGAVAKVNREIVLCDEDVKPDSDYMLAVMMGTYKLADAIKEALNSKKEEK